MTDVIVNYMALAIGGLIPVLALVYMAFPLRDKPHPDQSLADEVLALDPSTESRCTCEYIDVGIGSMLAVPDPDCVVHSMEMLAAMTYRRHTTETAMGIEAVRSHWAHAGCSCGCGGA